jgi:outer membrane protein TolC
MGQPTLASLERLPEFPEIEPVDIRRFDEALRIAFELRPEPRRLRLQRDRVAIEYELARNHLLPAVNAVVAASQDVGPGKSTLSGPNGLDRTNLSAGLAFQLPVQRRDAQGRMLAAQGLMIQLEQQLRQAEDVVRAEVQDTLTALERAYEFYQQAKNRVELARIVARGERELLRQGRSTVLAVTLREQAAFDAEVIEIDAQLNYFRALAAFRAALGIGGK